MTREAKPKDAGSIAEIYNQSISEGIATFETGMRNADEILAWLSKGYPIMVTEYHGIVLAFAKAFPYSDRVCYSGIVEFSVYVHRNWRGQGVGGNLMEAFITECKRYGYRKLVSRVFTNNLASLALLRKVGFREVGIYQKHGRIGERWVDVVIVERLIPENIKS